METSSLEQHYANVLTVSLILEDTEDQKPLNELPYLNLLFGQTPLDTGDVALAMNSHVFAARALVANNSKYVRGLFTTEQLKKADDIIANDTFVKDWDQGAEKIKAFVNNHFHGKRATLAGKNVASFDYNFLPEDVKKLFNHRMLDPGSMYATSKDQVPPPTDECCRRAGITDIVTHDAYGDGLQVIQLIRHHFSTKV